MHDSLSFFLCVLGVAFILEGLPSFIWSENMPKLLFLLAQQPPKIFRVLGFFIILFGLFLVFLGKRFL